MKLILVGLLLIGVATCAPKPPVIYKSDLEIRNTIDLTRPLVFDDLISERKVEKNVNFYLFTHRNPSVEFELNLNNVKESPFNPNVPTKLVTHGWTEHGEKGWIINIKNQYLMQGDYNVIAIDWSHYSRMEYSISSGKTRKVGSYVGHLIVKLVEELGADPADFHCAGHSLGAHVCGFTGKQVVLSLMKRIGRITGMDPAGPLFQFPIMASELNRLSAHDADFVDIIHSSGGTLGFSVSIGHTDFFPNEGVAIQKGCGIDIGNICSHSRSYEFFAESILSDKFVAVSCTSWKDFKKGRCAGNPTEKMGFYATPDTRGTYFLTTNKKQPYGTGSVKYTE